MELNHRDGKLQVHYSDQLVALLREVRQLSSLGYTIPAKIQHTSATAQKFYRHAVILKQVAHFYNTIDQQMISSQQPMMLDTARAFDHAIKNPRVQGSSVGKERVQVTWDDPKELEEYITKLQGIANQLTTENRRLRKCHTNFLDKVMSALDSVIILCQFQNLHQIPKKLLCVIGSQCKNNAYSYVTQCKHRKCENKSQIFFSHLCLYSFSSHLPGCFSHECGSGASATQVEASNVRDASDDGLSCSGRLPGS